MIGFIAQLVVLITIFTAIGCAFGCFAAYINTQKTRHKVEITAARSQVAQDSSESNNQ